jgi:hypothetical protein
VRCCMIDGFRAHMPHFSGHTHTRRERREPDSLTNLNRIDQPWWVQSIPSGGARPPAPSSEEVARLAYSYWEARGHAHGSDLEDWFRAERELSQRRQG